jgi:predicted nucleic acid-binding protein
VILVDSSVWIDYFRGVVTPQTEKLDSLLGIEPIATGDLILTEVLQGFVSDRDFNQAKQLMTSLVVVDLAGQGIAIQAARNFRALRKLGVTVRKTIDTVIATRCIESKMPLLYSDRSPARPIVRACWSAPASTRTFAETRAAIDASGAEIVTVAIRRTNIGQDPGEPNLLDVLPPSQFTILPNTAGCYTADDAVRTLRLARELLDGHALCKLEVLGDPTNLFPNMPET